MKAIIYVLAALAMAATLFTASEPAYARTAATVINSTPNAAMVEEFNARGLPFNPIHLRPGAQRKLRADTASIHAEMSLPGGRPWTQCGTVRLPTGILRIVVVARERCRIQH